MIQPFAPRVNQNLFRPAYTETSAARPAARAPVGPHNSAAPLRPRRPSSLPVNTRFYGIRGRDGTGNAKMQFSYIAPNSVLGAARGAEKATRSFSSPVRRVRNAGCLRIHDAAPACIRFRGKLFSIGKILIILLSKKSIIIILAEKLFSKQSKTRVLWGVFGGFEIPRGFSFFVLQKRRKRRTQAAIRGFRKISGRPLPLPPCISRKIDFLHIAPDFEPFFGHFLSEESISVLCGEYLFFVRDFPSFACALSFSEAASRSKSFFRAALPLRLEKTFRRVYNLFIKAQGGILCPQKQ